MLVISKAMLSPNKGRMGGGSLFRELVHFRMAK